MPGDQLMEGVTVPPIAATRLAAALPSSAVAVAAVWGEVKSKAAPAGTQAETLPKVEP